MTTPPPLAFPLGAALIDVELAELRYFHCVASTRSFAQGAQLAHVSSSAISKAIKRLESALGVELLRRTTRRVRVTEAGEMLMAYCAKILGAVDALSSELDARRGQLRGTLRVGASEVFTAHALPQAIAQLCTQHPQLLVKTFHLEDPAIERSLLEGKLDLGLCVGTTTAAGLEHQVMLRSPGVVACGRQHPLYMHGRLDLEDLAAHPFVVLQRFGAEHRSDLDGFALPERRIGATVELLDMAIRMATEGRLVGYFPRVAITGLLDEGRLRVLQGLPPGPPTEMCALTRTDEARRHAVDALLASLGAVLRRDPVAAPHRIVAHPAAPAAPEIAPGIG